jgi:hypothetical protein
MECTSSALEEYDVSLCDGEERKRRGEKAVFIHAVGGRRSIEDVENTMTAYHVAMEQ